MLSGVAGATDGADTIDVGAGMNYANGNAGNDTIIGGDGPNRLLGGQGDDQITAGNGKDSVNGNLGNDIITVGNGNDTVRGGQGDDVIRVGSGNDVIQGDLGNDTLHAGIGHDVMTGGSGADMFDFGSRPGSAMISEITDFDGVAGDRISIGSAISAGHILYDPGVDLVSEALAAQTAAGLIGTQTGMVAALQVGSDAYLFFNSANIGNVIQLDGIAASSIDSNDFAIVG
jgi:serralysin